MAEVHYGAGGLSYLPCERCGGQTLHKYGRCIHCVPPAAPTGSPEPKRGQQEIRYGRFSRRKREMRSCAICGGQFVVPRVAPDQKTCSLSCGQRLRRAKKVPGGA